MVEEKNSRDNDFKTAVILLARQYQHTLNKRMIPLPQGIVLSFATTNEHPQNLPNRKMNLYRDGDKTRTERLSLWVLNSYPQGSNFSSIVH